MLIQARQQFIALLNSEILADLILAVVILAITAACARFTSRLLRKLLHREKSPLPQSSIFINIARICVWGIGISIMLASCFNIDVSGIVTALGVGGIAISLGLKDTISNLIGGLQMSLMKTVLPGDHVEIGGKRGIVSDISWRHLKVNTSNGQTIVIPNSVITSGTIVKLPSPEKIIVPFNLPLDTPDTSDVIRDIEKSVKDAICEKYTIKKDPAISITSVGETTYAGSIVVWVNLEDFNYSETDVIKNLVVRAVAKRSHTAINR